MGNKTNDNNCNAICIEHAWEEGQVILDSATRKKNKVYVEKIILVTNYFNSFRTSSRRPHSHLRLIYVPRL